MRKIALFLLFCPLLVQADPHYGPGFDRAFLSAVILYLLVFPLLIAQAVSWVLARIKGENNNVWVVRISAILASWFGIYCILSQILSLHGDGLISAKGGVYLAAFAFAGACIAAPLATKR